MLGDPSSTFTLTHSCLRRSSVVTTQLNALEYIFDLALTVPESQDIFRTHGGVLLLSSFPQLLHSRQILGEDHDLLLSASRRALFSIEENTMNRALKNFLQLNEHFGPLGARDMSMNPQIDAAAAYFTSVFQVLQSLRYTKSALYRFLRSTMTYRTSQESRTFLSPRTVFRQSL